MLLTIIGYLHYLNLSKSFDKQKFLVTIPIKGIEKRS